MNTTGLRYPDALVSTAWLADNLDDRNLRIYDCTTFLHYASDTDKLDRVESGRSSYNTAHIPGSAFLDLQADLSDNDSPLRFTILPPEELAARFAVKGVSDGTRVILYSRANMQWATRVWWMLRYLGFDSAAVLDGGWDKWSIEGRTAATEPVSYTRGTLSINPRPDLFTGKDETCSAIGDATVCTINALAPGLHSGASDRYGRPGRIPGSINVPAINLQVGETRNFVKPSALAKHFEHVGTDRNKRIIVYCGGGIAATLDAFLLHQLGYENISVYDNSMSEWANDESLPIEVDDS